MIAIFLSSCEMVEFNIDTIVYRN